MSRKSLLRVVIPCFAVLFCGSALGETVKKMTAVAKKPPIVLPNDPLQLDFIFDKASDLKAFLRENGTFSVQGYIRHNHFRCGVYELGIQFGAGDGCVNVEWISQPVFVSRERQCNQAVLHHQGAAEVPEVVEKFSQVTCAQLHIKCEGTCGVADIPMATDPSSGDMLR